MKQTDGSSPETLATSLSFFDVNDHESHDGEREKKSSIAWNGRTRGKCSRAREHPYRGEKLRNSATNSLRIEKAMLREADLVFHSAGKTCGRFSGDVEIFAERFAESVLESKENTRRKSSTEQTTRFLSDFLPDETEKK